MVISEGLGSEPHPEEEIGTSNSNVGSEKSDFDSVGQETAKSMMTFLLPQAIPLLKKASMKKNSALSPLEILPRGLHSEKQSRGINIFSPGVVLYSFLFCNYSFMLSSFKHFNIQFLFFSILQLY